MGNILSKENLKKGAEECVKLANERFGLEAGLKRILQYLNINEGAKEQIIRLSKNRELDKLEFVLNYCHTFESKKPQYLHFTKKEVIGR